MEFAFDDVADALYIRLSKGEVVNSDQLNDNIIVDYDKDGQIIGIEVLNYSTQALDLNELIHMRDTEIIAKVAVT